MMALIRDSKIPDGRLLGFSALLISALILSIGVSISTARAATGGYSEIQVELSSTTLEEISLGHDDHTGASDHSGVNVSPVMSANFDLVGFLWDSGNATEIFARLRSAAGTWSDWTELGIHPDNEGPGNGTDPYWSMDSTGFQVAVVGEVVNLRAGIVISPEPPGSGSSSLASPTADSVQATGPSFVNPRSAWDLGNDCRPAGRPLTFSDVQGIVIHHTVSKATSAAHVPLAIDAICSFHVNGRGWDDIGYNAIVDPYGGVWEGRTGGLEAGISGAHAAGFNTSTQGVAMLGDFSTTPPTTAQEGALVDLLDWMTGWYLINPNSNVTLYSRSDGPKFEDGEGVTLPPIMGHRDLGVTSCPGDAGYARLPAIRNAIVPTPRTVGSSGGDELLTYNADNGRLRFENLHSTGLIDRPVSYGWVSRNWSSVEAIDLNGDGHDEIQFYNKSTGALVFHNLNTNGTLGSLIRSATLGTGWTTMEPADTDGDGGDELFFYRISDGRFGFYQVDANGFLGHGIRAGYFGKGWTSVEPVDIDGDGADEMMFYRKSDGRFAFYTLSSDGFIGSAIRVSNFGSGWDIIEPIDLNGDGSDELLFYRHSDGRYAYYELNNGGFIGQNISVGNYPAQWTSISSPELD